MNNVTHNFKKMLFHLLLSCMFILSNKAMEQKDIQQTEMLIYIDFLRSSFNTLKEYQTNINNTTNNSDISLINVMIQTIIKTIQDHPCYTPKVHGEFIQRLKIEYQYQEPGK